MIKICMLGILAILLSAIFKSGKQEFGIYICLIAGIIISAAVLTEVTGMKELLSEFNNVFSSSGIYLQTLFKMAGITYLSEFTSNLCKDAGYSVIAGQVEMFGKVTIMVMSIPVILSLIDTLKGLI